jgi:hypothetical protein
MALGFSSLTVTEVPVNSSAINSASYDPATYLLTISFTDGTEYTYDGVPSDVFTDFIGSSSPGSYFNKNIRGSYGYA